MSAPDKAAKPSDQQLREAGLPSEKVFSRWRRWWAVGLVSFLMPGTLGSAETQVSIEVLEKRAQQVYEESKERYRANPTQARAAWEFGRACYELADFASNKAQREDLAVEGIAACRLAIQGHPRIAPAHYYLALNLGQQARTKSLGALALVDEMEQLFLHVIELDAEFDFAGAHRAAGYLYRDAPGWPVSVGNKSKARSHFAKALELSPEYPGNHLAWMESLVEWGERKQAVEHVARAKSVMESARQKLSGERWEASWNEWSAKWQRILSQIQPDENSD